MNIRKRILKGSTWQKGWMASMALLVSFAFVLSAANCGDSHEPGMDHNGMHDGEMHDSEHGDMQGMDHGDMMNRETKTLELAGTKVSVDWMDMGQHHQMMKMDGHHMDMKDTDRHIMLTIADPSTNEQIRDAKASLTVTGPDGKKITARQATMSNKKMHHEGFSFAESGKGTYKVSITLKNGDKEETGEVNFELK
tara:strand:- start:458813 stop:459397 length:585 start_codon:yes stop_codon:yes gene_type:complete